MAVLTKEQILSADDLARETVTVPEWGGEVIVAAITAAERDSFEASIIGADRKVEMTNIRAKLVARCVVDESGARLFDESEIDDLGRKNAAALNRVFEVAQRLNGMSKADMEELEGNSAAAQ